MNRLKSFTAVALWVPLVALGQTYYGAGGEVTGYRLLYPNGAATYYDAQSRIIGSQSAPYVPPSASPKPINSDDTMPHPTRDNRDTSPMFLHPLLIDPTR